jgi:hypothetical protein
MSMNGPRCKIVTLLLVAVAMASATLAHSQSSEAQNPKWDFSIWAGGATGEEATNSFSEAQIMIGGFYVGRVITGELGNYCYRGRFEYGFDVAPLFVQFQPQRIGGTAFDPLIFRWHSSPRGGAITPFLELSGGAVHTTANFPAGDTSTINFITRGGGGLLVLTKPNQALEVAFRWWHISNANLGTRNPEFNGIQVSVGYHWMK